MKLRKWQEKAKQLWYDKNCKGTVEVCTGAGKTIFAIDIIKETTGNIIILVPTQVLLKQWKEKLEENIPEKIGVFYGAKKDVQRITVVVINSAWNKTLTNCNLLVFDECHKARGNQITSFLIKNNFNKILGLSATAEKEGIKDYRTEYFFKIAPVFYWYNIKDAQEDNVLVPYYTENVPVAFTPEEEKKYNKANSVVVEGLKHYGYNLVKVMAASKRFDVKAMNIMRAINRRKDIIFTAENKLAHTLRIIEENQDKKIILFDERIKNLEYFALKLSERGIPASIYHSGLKSKEKKALFSDFAGDKVNVMLSARSLEEGVDVPKCDMALIVNGSGMKRQHIQRVGRVLRLSEGKTHAIIYQIYVPATKDEDWIKKRTKNYT